MSPRSSHRKDLNIALRWANEAVILDTKGQDYSKAMDAYAKSVSLLSEVLETLERERGVGRVSDVRDDEIVKLERIHDSYRDRMLVLCLTFGFEMPPEVEKLMSPRL